MENQESKIRTFIAVPLPESTCNRMAELVKRLSESKADVKWVAEPCFHITLKFLGYLEPDQAARVCEKMEAALKGAAPFEVDVFGVGGFPGMESPSVVWVGVNRGQHELEMLADRVETACEGMGFEREARPFMPHITVGRVKTRRNAGELRDMLERLRRTPIDTITVDKVAVMKSELRREGPIYTVQKEIQLK